MKRILKHIPPLIHLGDASAYERVLSIEKFTVILNRERDRADRTGQEFSLAAFEVGNDRGKNCPSRNLVRILTQRIRSTDDIGWLGDGRIAVVLPHTTAAAAWIFVNNVWHAYSKFAPAPNCDVYSYPSGWITQGEEDPSRESLFGNAPRLKPESLSLGAQYSGVPTVDRVRPIEELESSFLRRIPLGKRAFDIVVSIFAMILLFPVFLLFGLYLRVVSPGPVFFRQERVGYLGRRFTLWKFRTMHVNADASVHRNHLHDLINNEKTMAKLDNGKDSRIIPYGYLIRATGIDELPQLINVLRGDMSLIGPRPCLPYEAREFASWQLRRFDTVPGLTGLWQVSGKNRTTFKEMMRLDIGYARNRAMLLDAMIFLKTVPAIIIQVLDRPSVANVRAKWQAAVLRAIPVAFVLSMMQGRRK
jgi:lipopolysaccharide/colanic/teichoic acid biosynthesis glycosyltransferase